MPDAAYRTPPHNMEAERALLGAALVNNKAMEKVAEFLRPEHFFDPANGRVYAAIAKMVERGQIANPLTLKDYFEQDTDLKEIGGTEYLARLAAGIVTVTHTEDYGRIIYDAYLRRQLIDVGEDMVNAAYKHDLDVPARDQVEEAERRLFRLAEVGQTGRALSLAEATGSFLTALDRTWHSARGLDGVTTGLADLDRRLGGMKPGQLVILAGRPSMGKTALSLNRIAQSAARAGHAVFVASYEMTLQQIQARLVATETGIGTDQLLTRGLSSGQQAAVVDAANTLAALPMHIDDAPPTTVSGLRAALRRHKRRHGLGLAVVDYLQLMRGESSRGGGENRVQEISEITRGLKAIAKELDVPVLALSQLSRQVENREDKRPQLSDLRDSGSIEQDADVVMFVYRESYYLERAEPARRPDEAVAKFADRHTAWLQQVEAADGLADVLIAKLRQGQVGTVRCAWNGPRQLFSDLWQGGQP